MSATAILLALLAQAQAPASGTPQAGAGEARSVRGGALIEGASPTAAVVETRDYPRPVLAYDYFGDGRTAYVFADELVVSVTAGDTGADQAFRDAVAKARPALEIVSSIAGRGIYLVRTASPSLLSPEQVLKLLWDSPPPGVHIEPNIAYTAAANQDLLGSNVQLQWALRNSGVYPGGNGGKPDADIDGFEALARLHYSTQPPSRRPIVAVLDTGLDIWHPMMAEALWRNKGEIPGDRIDNDSNGLIDDVNGWDVLMHSGEIQDGDEHGTHVAGIIGARPAPHSNGPFGVAPHALVMPLRVLTGSVVDGRLFAPLFAVISAHDYARRQGADVVNMSFESYVHSPLEEAEIALNHRAGLMMVAAAGNGVPTGVGVNVAEKAVYPCVTPFVICVAATDEHDRIAGFSNYGVHPQRPLVAIAAPGTNIWSTKPGGGTQQLSGTSMAAPMVAGALAQLEALYPRDSNDDRFIRLMGAADRLRGLELKFEEGRRLNLYHSLFDLIPAGASHYANNAYCSEKIPDPVTGVPRPRYENVPFANSGEPNIDGTYAGREYKICTARQLMSIEDEHLDSIFMLAQDIYWRHLPDGYGHPIGGQPRPPGQPHKPFTGSFLGDTHAIIGMTFRGRRTGGLFAEIGHRAWVRNLVLRDVDIDVTGTAGALTPKVTADANIWNVEAEGRVKAGELAGGLVGENHHAKLNRGFFEGEVTSDRLAGGVVGLIHGQRHLGWALGLQFNGTVQAPTAGGIAGHVGFQSWLSKSHAFALIHDAAIAGGIAGEASCNGLTSTSYANGIVTGSSAAGGLIGRMRKGSLRESYASVFMPNAGAGRGGVVGVRQDGQVSCPPGGETPSGANFRELYYDSFLTAAPGAAGKPLSPAQLRNPASFPEDWFPRFFHKQPEFMPALNFLPRGFYFPRPNPREAAAEAEPEER